MKYQLVEIIINCSSTTEHLYVFYSFKADFGDACYACYSEARHISGLPTLSERRTKLFELCSGTDFYNLLPPRTHTHQL